MVLTPLIAPAGTGQGINQGIGQAQSGTILANQGNNQRGQSLGPGSGPGGNMDQQGSGQNTAGPGWGNRLGVFGNATADAGQQGRGPGFSNMTAPPEMPGWNADNATAMGNMTRQHGLGFGNETATMPAPPQDKGTGTTTGQQADQSQPQATNDLFAEFLSGLKGRTGS